VPAVTGLDGPPFVLIVRPPYLDQLTFHDPVMSTVRRAGDFFPATDDALGSVLFTFAVPAMATQRDVFVRLQSASARVVHLSLMPLPNALAYTRWVEWATGTVWVMSLVFLVWSLVQWRYTRDRVMGIFVFKQGLITLWGFLFLGFARISVGSLLTEGTLSFISSVVVALAVASVLWFFSALLVEYRARPWMLRVMRAWALFMVGLGLLNFVGLTQLSLQIINSMVPLVLLWIVLTLLLARPEGEAPPIPKTVLLGYVFLYAVLNALPAMTHIGLIPESPILFVGNMSLLVVDGLVMLVILNVRQRRFQEQHLAVSTQLMLHQEQARLDRQYLEEQRQLLAMLAHEMKTPLANLRLWMEAGPKGRPVMQRAIHDMDRVIERCVHAGQLSDNSLRPRNEWLDAAELTASVLRASRHPGRVELHQPLDVCALHADAQMLSIVLSNVLENAYKYSSPHTPILFELTSSPGVQGQMGWRWVVENGVGEAGFPEASKVFDKYYRSPAAQRQSGSGLGLFLVKSLLELMQGSVTYTALENRVRFEIWLPRETAALPSIS
jgi:two-component system, sensor histidine kinase LadS